MSDDNRGGQDPPLAFLIAGAFDATVQALHERLPEHGFTDIRPVHCINVFRLIDAGGTRPGVLAGRARVSAQAMGEFVNYLEQHGYVSRTRDPSDGRARLIQLTPRGERAAAVARNVFADMDRAWTADMDPADVRILRNGLRHIATHQI